MEQLLASAPKPINLARGQQTEGEVLVKSEKEFILALGGKAEGLLPHREFSPENLEKVKVGDKLKVFVIENETQSGQLILSLEPLPAPVRMMGGKRFGGGLDFSKFKSAQNQKTKLQGKVLEINKGGLIVEVSGIRGFLPNSQVGFELIQKAASKSQSGADPLSALAGENLSVQVIEVDERNNRVIFSQKGQVSPEVKEALKKFEAGQKVNGKIVAVLPFGLVVDVNGVEGLVFVGDVSWDKVEDLAKLYKIGQELDMSVLGRDEDLGRLNLSIKALSDDPFSKLTEKYPTDEVVKAEVTAVEVAGISFKLSDGTPAFMASSKVDLAANYEVGKSLTMLVDSIDNRRRVVNLAPFVTSTADLMYK